MNPQGRGNRLLDSVSNHFSSRPRLAISDRAQIALSFIFLARPRQTCRFILVMPVFQSKPFRGSAAAQNLSERIAAIYRRKQAQNPFLYFGLPFITLMVAASFLLTPATALRYEKHDRKNRQVTDQEKMQLGLKGGATGEGTLTYNPRRRKVLKGELNERDEYYRLMAKDLDNWEQKRVDRWKGEPDGRL